MSDQDQIMDVTPSPRIVGLVILPGASRLEVCLLSEALLCANSVLYMPQYDIRVLDLDGKHGDLTQGVEYCTPLSPECSEKILTLFVFGGTDSLHRIDPGERQLLRRLSRLSACMGSVGNGAFALTELGYFDDMTVALHVEAMASFQERFPRLPISHELFLVAGRRFSCCGGTATIDLALYLISNDCGNDCAGHVADAFVHDRTGPRNAPQRTPNRGWLALTDNRLAKVVDLMRCHLEEPLSVDDLASSVEMNQRSLQRLFKRHLNCSPTNYYLQIRMWQARQLMLETGLSITEIGIACGFVSSSHFSVCYRNFFGKTPSDERKHRSLFLGGSSAAV